METHVNSGIITDIRKEFFAFRNGMIADTLRKGGLEQKYIFGLQLPQIKEIAIRYRPDNNDEAYMLAQMLWDDKECREARLLACHIMPPEAMTKEEASKWANDASSREESDILAFRLFRHMPFASELAEETAANGSKLNEYTASAIRRFSDPAS
ncbi:MAG: DNA alkylation repair protein [Muribaculaceae bacterium]|nr:DNA alkylation repair protein [Muribaculaceae bacterium]